MRLCLPNADEIIETGQETSETSRCIGCKLNENLQLYFAVNFQFIRYTLIQSTRILLDYSVFNILSTFTYRREGYACYIAISCSIEELFLQPKWRVFALLGDFSHLKL